MTTKVDYPEHNCRLNKTSLPITQNVLIGLGRVSLINIDPSLNKDKTNVRYCWHNVETSRVQYVLDFTVWAHNMVFSDLSSLKCLLNIKDPWIKYCILRYYIYGHLLYTNLCLRAIYSRDFRDLKCSASIIRREYVKLGSFLF